MIRPDEYIGHDALGLARLVATGQVSAPELLEVAIARAQALNPLLNAIVIPTHELARQRARGPLHGPFAGVPFLCKDLFQEIEGVATAQGCRALQQVNFKAGFTAQITARWLAAGVVVFGRTNTPEFGAKPVTEPVAWGPTRNPWNLACSPGGSSGGSAAAVAAGIVPVAGANDGGGSIRIPASYCGLFGFKPGRGRTPWGPAMSESIHGAAMNHVLSRSVRDSAAMLDATHGSEAGSLCRLAPPVRPYLEEVGRDPRRLRIALCGRSPIGTEVDVEAVNALMQAAKLLESAGHDLCEAEPDLDGVQLAKDFVTIWFATCAATVRAIKAQTGCRNTDFELDTQAAAAFGEATSAREYVECYRRCSGYTRALADFHKRFDVYMTPMTSAAAPRIGEIATAPMQQLVIKTLLAFRLSGLVLKSGVLDQMVRDNLARIPFAQLSNLTGTPSMSVPLHWTQQGMPLGVQFVADHGSEGLLFSLAGQLERAQPWFDRHPPLAVQPATASSAPAPAACLRCARRPAAG